MAKLLLSAILASLCIAVNCRPLTSCYAKWSSCGPIKISPSDRSILLEFKSSIRSELYPHLLDDWNSSLTCENGWSGVCTGTTGRVTEIIISDYYFRGTIPNSFGNLSKLQYLDLGGNAFTSIPATLSRLSNLVYLDLNLNLGLQASAIVTVSNLKALEYLDLSFTGISNSIIPSFDSLRSLRYLDLTSNDLRGRIPSSYTTFKNLSSLFLGYNRLCGSLPPQFAFLPRLKHLDVSYNYLTGQIPKSYESKICKQGSLENNCLLSEPGSICDVGRKPNYYCSIGCDPVPNIAEDIAASAYAFQSSTYWFGSPLAAVDGSTGNGIFPSRSCAHTLNQSNPNLGIDLGVKSYVSTVQLYNRLDCCSDRLGGVQVFVGSSSRAYNAFGNKPCRDPKFVYSERSKGFPLNVTCNLSGSHVWVVVPGKKKVLSVCEVVVLGKPSK